MFLLFISSDNIEKKRNVEEQHKIEGGGVFTKMFGTVLGKRKWVVDVLVTWGRYIDSERSVFWPIRPFNSWEGVKIKHFQASLTKHVQLQLKMNMSRD